MCQKQDTPPSITETEAVSILNEMMKKLVPELDSEYASYPMALERWHYPQEVLESGKPCFIPCSEQGEVRQDYIWMPERRSLKSLPAGYYHLSTREAYVEVYSRLTKISAGHGLLPTRKKFMLKSKRDRQVYSKIKESLENRLMCEVPNDVQAARMRVCNMQHHMGGTFVGKAAFLPKFNGVVMVSKQ